MRNAPSDNNLLPALVYRAVSRIREEGGDTAFGGDPRCSVGRGKHPEKLLGKWNIWVKERDAQGKGPWLHTLANQDLVLAEVLEFMTCRCLVHNNQQSTVRGY